MLTSEFDPAQVVSVPPELRFSQGGAYIVLDNERLATSVLCLDDQLGLLYKVLYARPAFAELSKANSGKHLRATIEGVEALVEPLRLPDGRFAGLITLGKTDGIVAVRYFIKDRLVDVFLIAITIVDGIASATELLETFAAKIDQFLRELK